MAFTDIEIAEHMKVLEETFWSRRRPPVHIRDKMREGQRFSDRSIELFFVRPMFRRPDEFVEESLAKVRHVLSRDAWQIFWKRADGKWHRYQPYPEAPSLKEALVAIDEDPHGCFFG